MYELGEKELRALATVIESRQTFRYRGGEGGFCDRFEAALCRKVGVSHAVAVSSGTAALICGLVGIGIRPGDEVIVPAYTFMATALAVTAAGGIPIVADIDESLTLDPEDVERRISPHTRAIIAVHMNGRICDLAALDAVARRRGVALVEDACQAIGGSYRGECVGSIGEFGAFSFNHFKILSCGEGGALMTSRPEIYERGLIQHDGGCAFRDHAKGMTVPFFAGHNYRISEFQGAILLAQLERLDAILARLRARQAAMADALCAAPGLRLAPNRDPDGDCGTTLTLTFGSEAAARAFAARAAERAPDIGVLRPIDSGRHVYTNWEPIMRQRGAHTEELNPFRWAKRPIVYSDDMCSRSLDILARTVNLSVPYSKSVRATFAACRRMTAPTCARGASFEPAA
jgi:dTDP-4-amino-4,6-dideoxygalactose transaminase